MAVPIIVGAAAAVAGLYGVVRGVSGIQDHNNASRINDDASTIIDRASKKLDKKRARVNTILEDYGQRKWGAFNGVIADFLSAFGQIRNISLEKSVELDRLSGFASPNKVVENLNTSYQALQDAGLGLGAGMTSGAALAFGAYNGTMLLASASTGTAISSLGGAAATNATLAWLGGGSLATGGLGILGGKIVLGSIVGGPALAVFGHIMGNKGETALNDARSNFEEAQSFELESQLIVTKLDAIGEVALLADKCFATISKRLEASVQELQEIINRSGTDFKRFSKAEKQSVFMSVKYAQLLKALIDVPILDQDGNLIISTEKRIHQITESI